MTNSTRVSIDEVSPAEWDNAFKGFYTKNTVGKINFSPDSSGPDLDCVGIDAVNAPKHYVSGKIECIDYIQDRLSPEAFAGFLEANITKYLHRWRDKDGVEDLRKARWYLDRLIKETVS
jgi:hypothetical protein